MPNSSFDKLRMTEVGKEGTVARARDGYRGSLLVFRSFGIEKSRLMRYGEST